MLKVFEAFSGYGSQSMALRNIGVPYKVVGISEINENAIKAYMSIHGNTPNYGDISKLDVLPQCDLFTYSFPCQDISLAGTKKGLELGSNTRSSLLWECKRLIESGKPKYLLLENVKNLVGKKNKHDFDKWCEYLETLGYKNYWKVLNARDYGIPQSRERIFMVSILGNDSFNFPESMLLKTQIKDLLETNVDPKYYLTDNGRVYIVKRQKNIKDTKVIPTLTCELTHGYGGLFCPTWTTLINEFRVPTPREAFRFMGVSDSDIDKIISTKISRNAMYRLAGNSIVVPVLEAIFKELFKTKGVS
jgi:DNA (cytosine-5)-methyltransferase 1